MACTRLTLNPPSTRPCNNPPSTQCVRYFEMYADHFNLRSSIRLNTRVRLIKPAPDYASTGRYTAWYTTKDEPEVEETFDAVMVCTGHHWQPRTPAFAGLDRFRGTTMHAHSYKDHRGFENKHVVVVGVGNSGTCGFGRRGRRATCTHTVAGPSPSFGLLVPRAQAWTWPWS